MKWPQHLWMLFTISSSIESPFLLAYWWALCWPTMFQCKQTNFFIFFQKKIPILLKGSKLRTIGHDYWSWNHPRIWQREQKSRSKRQPEPVVVCEIGGKICSQICLLDQAIFAIQICRFKSQCEKSIFFLIIVK